MRIFTSAERHDVLRIGGMFSVTSCSSHLGDSLCLGVFFLPHSSMRGGGQRDNSGLGVPGHPAAGRRSAGVSAAVEVL